MKPVTRLMTSVLKKRSVCFSVALLLCMLAYAYYSMSGARTANSFAAGVPVEIGSRVWNDSNRNGLQDAGEAGIKGVTVHLYNNQGQMIGSATTDADGRYHFSVSPDAEYVLKLDNAADYTSGPLKGYQLTTANGDCQHVKDSRAVLPNAGQPIGAGNYPQMAVNQLVAGKNADTFNVGFVQAATKTVNDENKPAGHDWSRCKPFPPKDGPTPTPTPDSGPILNPTPEMPTVTPTPDPTVAAGPTKEPTKPTPGPKKPVKPMPTKTLPTKFPSLPPTGSSV